MLRPKSRSSISLPSSSQEREPSSNKKRPATSSSSMAGLSAGHASRPPPPSQIDGRIHEQHNNNNNDKERHAGVDVRSSSGTTTLGATAPGVPTSTAYTASQYNSFKDLSIESTMSTDAFSTGIKAVDSPSSNTPPPVPETKTTTTRNDRRQRQSVQSTTESGSATRSKANVKSDTTTTTTTTTINNTSGRLSPSLSSFSSTSSSSSSAGVGRAIGSNGVSQLSASIPTSPKPTSNTNNFDPTHKVKSKAAPFQSSFQSSSIIPATTASSRSSAWPTGGMARCDKRIAAASEFSGSLLTKARRKSELEMQQKRQEIKRELMLNDPKSPYLRELRREDGEAVDSSFDGAGSDNDGRGGGGGMSQDDGHRHRKKEKEKMINMDVTSGRRSTSPMTQQGPPISRTTPSPTALRPNGYISKKQSNHESKGASTIPNPVLSVVQSSTAVAGSGRRSPNPNPSYEHMTTHGSSYTEESNPLSAATATGTAVATKKEAKKTEASFSEQRVPEQIRALEKDADRHIQAAKERNRRLEQLKEWIMQYKERGTSATEEMEEAEGDDAEEETEGEKEAEGRSLQVMDSEDSTADKEKIEQLEKALAEMETKLQRASARQVETERQLRQAEAKCSVYNTKMDKLARTAEERQMMLEHLILEDKGADDSQFQSWYERYSLLLERHNQQSPKKDKWKEARLRRAKRWSQKRRERQERIDAMSAQVAQQQNQLTAVQAQLSESKAKVESLNQLKATNSDLEAKNLELATLLEEHQRHGLNHRKQLQDKDTEIDQLKHDIEVFKQQEQTSLLKLEQQQQDFQAREEDLSEELKTAMSQLKRERQLTASLKQKLLQQEQEGQQSKSASEQQYLSSKMKELDALSHQVVELGTTLEQMSHWLTVLRDEFRGEDEDGDDDGINGPASASAHGHDGDHHEPQSPSSLATVDGQFEYLRRRIRNLKQDRDAQAQQLIDNEIKEADLKQQMAELEQELHIVVDHIAEIRQENQKKFENQQRQHEQRSRELEAEIEELKDEIYNLKKEIDRKNDALAVLQSQLDDAQGKLQLQNERTAHLEADLANTNTQLSKDLEATKAALATSESTVRKLEQLIEEAEQQNQGRCRHCRSSATDDDSEYVSYGGSPNQSSMLSVSSCAMCRHSIRGHSEDEQENEARRQHETILREQVDQLEKQIAILETELTRSEKKRCELQEELEELSGMVEDQAEGARSMYAKKLERIKRLENENKELRQLVIKQETNLYLYHSRVITLKFERGKLLEELHKRDRQDRQDALLDAEKEGRGKLLQGKEKSLGERKERRTLAPPNEIEG